jgi:hypothetical protein
VTSLLGRAAAALRTPGPPPALDGFVGALLQTFENCRAGLADEAVARGASGAEAFFRALYLPERDRLRDVIRLEQPHLAEEGRAALFDQVDRLVAEVVIPAYVRVAVPFTRRERNDFYLGPPALRVLERAGCALLGGLLGAFVVWAPFIPVWSKEWVFPFFLAGLVFPELRRLWGVRRFGRELDRTVARADAEIGRIDVSYLLRSGLPASGARGGEPSWSRSQAGKEQSER